MQTMTIDIPSEVMEAAKLPPGEQEEEFRKELAIALYRRGILSLGKARIIAQMTRWEFEELLGARRTPRHYSESDLEDDIRYAAGNQ